MVCTTVTVAAAFAINTIQSTVNGSTVIMTITSAVGTGIYRVLLDGSEVWRGDYQNGAQKSVTINNMAPGTHTVCAEVV